MKKMRHILAAVLAATLIVGTVGCAQTASTYTGKSYADGESYTITAGAVRTAYVTDEIMEKADMWVNSDDTRVAEVLRKAEAGEEVTIALIGGSITQGTISNGANDSIVGDKKCYAEIFREWWTAMFPNTKINFVNAGIGGTDSYLGVHRVAQDVLSADPDLVVVEYAVNDADTNFYQTTYDNLVRRLLKADAAVIMLIMAQTNGSSAQAKEAMVAVKYSVPALSYYAAMTALISGGTYTAEELSGDTVHPSALGHAITGELLWNYLNEVYANRKLYGESTSFTAEALTSDKYAEAKILDSETITPDGLGTFSEQQTTSYFPNGWQSTAGEGGISFTAEFANLGILYQKTVDGLSGQFDVYVDGEKVGTINANFANGWGDAMEGMEVYTSEEVKSHTVEIRKSSGSTGEKLNLLGLLVS